MSTNKIDKLPLRPASASTTRHAIQHSQHLPATTRSPFLGFQFYLGPLSFHTILRCTNIQYTRVVEKLPQPRLHAFQPLNISIPSHEDKSKSSVTIATTISPSICARINRIRPMFLEGYSQARATKSSHDNITHHNPPTGYHLTIPATVIPPTQIQLPTTGLSFPLHAVLDDASWGGVHI